MSDLTQFLASINAAFVDSDALAVLLFRVWMAAYVKGYHDAF